MKKEQSEIIESKNEVTQQSKGAKVKVYGKVGMFLVLLVVAVVAMILLFFLPEKKIDTYFITDADGTVYVADFKSPRALSEGVTDIADEHLMIEDIVNRQVLSGIQVDDALDFVYYPVGQGGIGDFDLYRHDYEGKEKASLIDSNVIFYDALGEGAVVYQKKDASVYVYAKEESNCVTNHATSFWLNEKGSTILWEETDIEGNKRLYYVGTNLKKDEKEVSAKVDEVLYVSKDLKNILVKFEGDLYRISDLKKTKLVAENIEDIYGYEDENDSFYYIINEHSLYYFDGKNSEVIDEKVENVVFSQENLVMFQKDLTLYIASQGNMARVDLDDVRGLEQSSFLWDQANERCFLLDAIGKDKALYAISYSEKDLGLVEKIDTNVEKVEVVVGDKCYYIKNGAYVGSSFVGDLYCMGECVQEKISVLDVTTALTGSNLYYYTDFKVSNKTATLMKLDGTKTKEIAQKVIQYYAYNDKNIMVMAQDTEGNIVLYHYNGSKLKKVMDNVVYFYSTEEPQN